MSQERIEQLYAELFGVIEELTEYSSAEEIFDRIVEDFAYSVEEANDRQRRYTELLNMFRKNDPVMTIPEEPLPQDMAGLAPEDYEIYDSQATEDDRPVNWEAIEANLDPSTRSIMSGSPDKFLDFLKGIDFPDRLGS